jgi:hypothetical protein
MLQFLVMPRQFLLLQLCLPQLLLPNLRLLSCLFMMLWLGLWMVMGLVGVLARLIQC